MIPAPRQPPDVLHCRALSLREARGLPRLQSDFSTDRVYQLERLSSPVGLGWQLREERLSRPHYKLYDSGRVDEWLESYAGSSHPEDFQFIGVFRDNHALGALTWLPVEWNGTLWLIDIRVREAARRSGAGSALVEALKREAVRRRVRGISVETQTDNYPALQFYRRHGFEITGFNDHLYSNDDLARNDVALFLFWEVR